MAQFHLEQHISQVLGYALIVSIWHLQSLTAERFNYIYSDYNVQVIKDNVVSWNTDYRKKKQSFEFTWYEVKCISTVRSFVQANVTAVTLRVSFSNTLK